MKHGMGEQGTPDGVRIPGKDERHGQDPAMVEESVNVGQDTASMAANVWLYAVIKIWGWQSSERIGGGRGRDRPRLGIGGEEHVPRAFRGRAVS